jgi:hypothetical protein
LNPLKDGFVKQLEDWAFSSYLEFIAAREGKIYVPGFRERFFSTPAAYAEFVAAYGADEDKDLEKWLDLN